MEKLLELEVEAELEAEEEVEDEEVVGVEVEVEEEVVDGGVVEVSFAFFFECRSAVTARYFFRRSWRVISSMFTGT